jgi:hypothetical protein
MDTIKKAIIGNLLSLNLRLLYALDVIINQNTREEKIKEIKILLTIIASMSRKLTVCKSVFETGRGFLINPILPES